MQLHREIRAFYVKLPNSYKNHNQDTVDSLWDISRNLPIIAIDINISKIREVLIHSEMEFSLENWNTSIRYLRSVIDLLSAKSGYLIVRKIIASKSHISTEVEGYKITKRGVYNAELPESPDFIEEVIRFSGRNKRLQQIDAMKKLFRFIKEQENDKENNG
jgi:hypothetical protein